MIIIRYTQISNMAVLIDDELIAEFRLRFEGTDLVDLEDHLVWAMLTGCNGDQDKSERLLHKLMDAAFRLTEKRVLNFKDYLPQVEVEQNLKHKFLGYDQSSQPVVWSAIGRWNPRELIEKGLRKELFLCIMKLADDIFRQVYEQRFDGDGIPIGSKATMILDLKDMALHRFLHYETIRLLLGMVRDVEPLATLLSKIYVINCSWPFYYFLNMIKPFISRKTIAKLEILDTNPNKWKEVLRCNFAEDMLPSEYGGTGAKVWG